jgi:hypothetical protein
MTDMIESQTDQKDHENSADENDNTQRPPGDWQSPVENPTAEPGHESQRDHPEESTPEAPTSPEVESDGDWDGSDREASDLRV